MFQAFISDFDGVLFDSEPYHFEAAQQVFAELGLDLTHEIFLKEYIGLTDFAFMYDFLITNGRRATPEEINRLILRKMRLYKTILAQHTILASIDGVMSFLAQLTQSIKKIAICSNAKRHDLDLVLQKLDGGTLQNYFQFTISADDVKHGKPEPEGYLLAAQRLGVDPKQCFVIEDSRSGIAAAKKAGMTVIGLTTSHPPEVLYEADYIAQDYPEIFRWLQKQIPY